MVSVIRINGKVVYDLREDFQLVIPETEARKIDDFLGHLKRHKKAYMSMAYALALITLPTTTLAASAGINGGMNLILLLQKASFWVGMGVTIWGFIEMGLDAPGWRGRVLKGVILYVGVLLVPLVFLELQNNLQVDVWNQIKTNGGATP